MHIFPCNLLRLASALSLRQWFHSLTLVDEARFQAGNIRGDGIVIVDSEVLIGRPTQDGNAEAGDRLIRSFQSYALSHGVSDGKRDADMLFLEWKTGPSL